VQACVDAASVGEDHETRLIIVDPEYPHTAKTSDSPARTRAAQILDGKGTGPRIFKNTVVFLAADRGRLDDLKKAARDFLAWKSIDDEHELLNLDASQTRQAKAKRDESDGVVNQRIPEAYQWLLVPTQDKPQGEPLKDLEWSETRLTGQDTLATRASKKLRAEEALIVELAGTRLKMELDRIPLWRGNHVPVAQLADEFAQYLYLPRLQGSEVLAQAVRDGLRLMTWAQDSFAYADSFDETKGRYVGLKAGQLVNVAIESGGLVVKPEVAKTQLDAEATVAAAGSLGSAAGAAGQEGDGHVAGQGLSAEGGQQLTPRRFHGSLTLNPIRLSRDAGTVADEVVQHLTKLPGAKVEVTLEIRAEIPDGAPDSVVRTVTENCRTLKFSTHGFEKE
jgi:hypothetical protein